MPHFYFHLDQGGDLTVDCEGAELPDLEVARAVAIRSARDIMIGDMASGNLDLGDRISIADAAGHVLLDLPFSKAVAVRGM